jgi:hypothetical protein
MKFVGSSASPSLHSQYIGLFRVSKTAIRLG